MSLEFKINVTGLDEVLKNLNLVGENAKNAAAEAMLTEATNIIYASKAMVPVDQGTLKGGAIAQAPGGVGGTYVTQPTMTGNKISTEFGYNGPYAARVHENPRAGKTEGVSPKGRKYQHWARVGEFKFLEKPFLAAEAGMLQRMAARIKSGLK